MFTTGSKLPRFTSRAPAPSRNDSKRAWRQCLANIETDDVPHELRLQFLELASQIQRERPLRGEDAVRATIRKMSNEEAERHASLIVRMFCRLTRQQELELPLPVPGSGAAVVQLFAAAKR